VKFGNLFFLVELPCIQKYFFPAEISQAYVLGAENMPPETVALM
jgi:hypothetical protein